MALDEVRQGRLNQRIAVISSIGKDMLVFDDVKIVNAQLVAITRKLDGVEGAIADVNSPGKAGGSHDVLSIYRGGLQVDLVVLDRFLFVNPSPKCWSQGC